MGRQRDFPCQHCPKMFFRQAALNRRVKTSHEGVRATCLECGVKVVDLRNHRLAVHIEKRFPCAQCPYKSKDKTDLQKHVEVVHEGVKEECPHCGKNIAYLRQHIKRCPQ